MLSRLFYAAISMQRSYCSIDGCEQIPAIEWLPEETTIVPSESQRFDQLIAAADKDYGQFGNFTVSQSLQFSASHARHTDITNQAVNVRKTVTFEKFHGGLKQTNSIAGRPKQLF
jgi:hypothetical protein